ncbi:MAG: amidophosphoribosyltransferase [Planctomycetota bacterium]|jgi:amidophosphoribosyltransferase|nr:amidophosphoribosyltransferase [Planctomycetota bacterium]
MDERVLTDECLRESPREECGVFGVFGCPEAGRLVYEGLFSQQHRGQEGAGIVVSDGKVRSLKGLGLLSDAIDSAAAAALPGDIGIGHVRYSTTGTARTQNVQPLVGETLDGLWAVAHNGNIVNAPHLRRLFQDGGSLFQTGTDSEILLHLLASPTHRFRDDPIKSACERMRGSYSFLIMSETSLTAVRDPLGFKPLVMGKLGEGRVFASETCALTSIGADYLREVEPGEIITADRTGLRFEWLDGAGRRQARCIFELIYFARPDSLVFGRNVHQVRVLYGERLAEEHPVDADIVISVPDSGNSSALGYSRKRGIPFDLGFIRNHYVGRTFIMPGASNRAMQIDRKLAPLLETVKGKRVVVVDDSIVRGNTMQRRVKSLRAAGAKEVHLRIACPPIRHPCFYGIDFPTSDELVAWKRSEDEVRDLVGADSLGYLSIEGLLSPFEDKGSYCLACFDGDYPIEQGSNTKEVLETGNFLPEP